MDNNKLKVTFYFLTLIVLVKWGTDIFLNTANPFALLLATCLFSWYSFVALSNPQTTKVNNTSNLVYPWIHAFVGIFGIFTATEELRKLWIKFSDYARYSDVIPQLKSQCNWFFSGQFPYQEVTEVGHHPFPVYMPFHWFPVQISNLLGIDVRWSSIIMLAIATGLSGFLLSRYYTKVSIKLSIPGMLLFALPLWAFVLEDEHEIALSLEGIVTAWYLVLAVGLATKNHIVITIGLIGAVLSRYSLLFWLPAFALLLWLNVPKRISILMWGSVILSVLVFFVFPFWVKEPNLVHRILDYYYGAADNSWLRPDEYTFKDGLSFNIHFRNWLPGTPIENKGLRTFPQVITELIICGLGVYFYQKKWKNNVDLYTFSLILLFFMIMILYLFSPMLFQYYLLMPLSVSALITWLVIVK
ncbi:MAG: hypothetical protein R3A50_07410 [Saprospiraceae bacterium]|nr:hypothetical protein [Saprospiraceae bacterium]MCB9345240.1 hypothetical protein [Lewinellaceae bacterium]